MLIDELERFKIDIQSIEAEELAALVEQLKEPTENSASDGNLSHYLLPLFQLFAALVALQDYAEARNILTNIREKLDELSKDEPLNDDLALLDIEWQNQAIAFVVNAQDHFVEYELFDNILQICRDRESNIFYLKSFQANCDLLRQYNQWVEQGAQTETLDEEQTEYLNYLSANIESEAAALFEKFESEQDFAHLIAAKRIFGRFHYLNGKPNDMIALLKEAVNHFEQWDASVETDKAELILEIGIIFHNHEKYKSAAVYFEQANDIYQNAGEAFEMFAIQTEALLDEAKKKM